jgi:hydroxyquinol 1,2-dioxygenase
MRNIGETTIADAVLQSIAATPDARLKRSWRRWSRTCTASRAVGLTEAGRQAGIASLTATGQKCSNTRQESILLSDRSGLSMLTIALNHAKPAGAPTA